MRQDRILGFLGLAEKAGKCVSGEFSVEHAVRQKKAKCVILANDASDNTKKKFSDKCAYYQIPCYIYGTKESLGRAIGKQYRSSVAVTDEGFARNMNRFMKEGEHLDGENADI